MKSKEFQIKLRQRLQSSFLAVTPHPLCPVHKREREIKPKYTNQTLHLERRRKERKKREKKKEREKKKKWLNK